MATPRRWESLAESTRKRYLRGGARQGLTPAQTRTHYESGKSVQAWRVKTHSGLSERQWTNLRKHSTGLGSSRERTIILDSLLQKGYTPAWILTKLAEQKESRDTYRNASDRRAGKHGDKSAGREPGRSRYFARPPTADIELFYYH